MEEIVDVEMQSAQKNHPSFSVLVPPTSGWPPIPTQNPLGPKSSLPKEPSKLRFSVQPESTISPTVAPELRTPQMSPEVNFAPSVPVPTFMVAPSIPAQGVPPTSGFSSPFIPKIDSKYTAGTQQLPTFAFASPIHSTVGNSESQGEAQSAIETTLPAYDITL